MLIALILFAVGGSIGAYMLLEILKKREVPRTAIISHGAANTLGLLLLIAGVIEDGKSFTLLAALILFLIAAAGGVILFYFDKIKEGMPPKILVAAHPLAAIGGIAMLIIYLGLNLQ